MAGNGFYILNARKFVLRLRVFSKAIYVPLEFFFINLICVTHIVPEEIAYAGKRGGVPV